MRPEELVYEGKKRIKERAHKKFMKLVYEASTD
jgi:hypothetical protein